MTKRLKLLWTRVRKHPLGRWGARGSALLLVIVALAFARAEYVLWRAEKIVTGKGFFTLASELLYPYRSFYVGREKGCRIMLMAFFEGRNLERTDWAAQACLEAGVEIPEVYIALGGVRENTNRIEEAVSVYSAGLQKFSRDAALMYRMARIQLKNGNGDEAERYMTQAAELLPQNVGMQIDAVGLIAQRGKWSAARSFADRIRSSNQQNRPIEPQVNALLAMVYSKVGDQGMSKERVQAAAVDWRRVPSEMRTQLAKLMPEIVTQIENEAKRVQSKPQGGFPPGMPGMGR